MVDVQKFDTRMHIAKDRTCVKLRGAECLLNFGLLIGLLGLSDRLGQERET